MKFFTDHYSHIGAMHLSNGTLCQDYASSKVLDQAALAVVSDGCSSGQRTDIGSRILTLATASALEKAGLPNIFSKSAFLQTQDEILRDSQLLLNLQQEDLLATSLSFCLSENGLFVQIQGDGLLLFKYRDGSLRFFKFEWQNNLPYYPAYQLGNLPEFLAAHAEQASFQQKEMLYSSTGELLEEQVSSSKTMEVLPLHLLHFTWEELGPDLEFVALYTDGVFQVEGKSLFDLIKETLAFKTTKGNFVKRRLIRLFKKLQLEGLRAMDDFSLSVVRIVYTEEDD